MCRRIEILKSVSWSILFQIELADGTVLDTFCSFQHQKIQRSATSMYLHISIYLNTVGKNGFLKVTYYLPEIAIF